MAEVQKVSAAEKEGQTKLKDWMADRPISSELTTPWQESKQTITLFKREQGLMEERDLWETQLTYTNGY